MTKKYTYKEILKQTERQPFDKEDASFFGNLCKNLNSNSVSGERLISMDPLMKKIGDAKKVVEGGIMIYETEVFRIIFVNHIKNKKNICSVFVNEDFTKPDEWEHARDYDTLKDASTWITNIFKMAGEIE